MGPIDEFKAVPVLGAHTRRPSRVVTMKYLDVDGVGRVSRIGLGTWQFGSREWGYGEGYASGAARDIVRRARALGVTLFDTAEVYGLGKSERILGEALGDERDRRRGGQQGLPGGPVPRRDQAARARQRAAAGTRPHPALPDSPAQPGGPRFGDHAGNARACSTAATSARPASRTTRWRGGERPMPRSGGRSSATRCTFRSPTPVRWRTWCPSPSARTAS